MATRAGHIAPMNWLGSGAGGLGRPGDGISSVKIHPDHAGAGRLSRLTLSLRASNSALAGANACQSLLK